MAHCGPEDETGNHVGAPVTVRSTASKLVVAIGAVPREDDMRGVAGEMSARARQVAPPATALAGRRDEQKRLRTALDDAAAGIPCAFLIHGEAGVGKTRLVRQVCDDARERGFTVLWGRCVRLSATEASYHPLLRALHDWAADADAAERARVLGSAATVEEFARGSIEGPRDGSGLFDALDAVIAAIAGGGPTILVVDDLQWADLASRDALAYLVAGFHRQSLALLVTYRDEDLVAAHSLHGWLADARRLPAVVELVLARLDQQEVQQQLRELLGRDPAPALLDDVVRRAQGNPYLTELLVQDLSPDAEQLTDRVSAALSDALLARWHRLSTQAREVLRILAVGGRPVTSTRLADVANMRDIDRATTAAALQDATDHGIVIDLGQDMHWFRHPLLAELLYATYSRAEAAPIHGVWAHELSLEPCVGVEELQRQSDLALHHERHGELRESLGASLRAADLAEEIHAVREVAQHLQRARRLWPRSYDDEEGRRREVDLLERSARASRRAGDGSDSLEALTRALDLVDAGRDPLVAARIMVYRADTAWFVRADAEELLGELHRAVELSRPWPDSAEYAEALTELAGTESWLAGEADAARRHGEEAIAAARRSGSPGTLANALIARAYARGFNDETVDEDTRTALALSLEGGEHEDACWAYLARNNALVAHGRLADEVAVLREGFDFARETAELSMVVHLASALCQALLTMGRLREAAAVIREGLARSAVQNAGAAVRLAAASLAVRTGQLQVAELHLRRAHELMPNLAQRPALEAPPVLAEVEVACGRGDRALRLLEDTFSTQSLDQRVIDEMLMWGARAAADLAERARGRRDAEDETRAKAALQALVSRQDALASEPFTVSWPDDLVRPALQAVFEAEAARCAGGEGTSSVWERAVDRCEGAGMRWEAETSRLRWSQALAVERAPRSVVAAQVRTGHRFCLDVEAAALRKDFELLAQVCGIDLAAPAGPAPSSLAPPFDALTPREREVLSHLVAGRTYAEIAEALFIGEKTVSTHVSHLLHKTGTQSRREVSVLFQRARTSQP